MIMKTITKVVLPWSAAVVLAVTGCAACAQETEPHFTPDAEVHPYQPEEPKPYQPEDTTPAKAPNAEPHFSPDAEPHFAAEPVSALDNAKEPPVQQINVNPAGPRHNVHVANIACKNVECSAAKWSANAPDHHYLTIAIPRGVVDVFNVRNAAHRKALTVFDAKGKVAYQDGFGGDCYPDTCYGNAQLQVEYFADGKYSFKVVQVNNRQVLASGSFTIQSIKSKLKANPQAGNDGGRLYREALCVGQAAYNSDVKCERR